MPSLVGFPDLFIRRGEHDALLRGSTLLIAGPPGAGKTTFAFALARSLMANVRRAERKSPLLFYVSLENDAERLRRMFAAFGWFDVDSAGASTDGVFDLTNEEFDRRTVLLIVLQPEIDRPVHTSEEVVNTIFTRISAESPPGENRPVFVIVDSLTSLIHDAGNAAERRRQVHELIYRIRKAFGKDLQLSLLLSERREESSRAWSPSVEEYLADVVFRLDVKDLAMGRRLRSLDIIKSQGSNMILGEHTWHICSSASYRDHIIEKHMRGRITHEATRYRDNKGTWGTVAVFSRSRSFNLSTPYSP